MTCETFARGVGFGPATRTVLLREAFSATEGATGQRHTVILKDALGKFARDKLGRYGHLIGLMFSGRLRVDFTAADMPAAMPGALFETYVQNLALDVMGHRCFIGNIDTGVLAEDLISREGVRLIAVQADQADADAANDDTDLVMAYTFAPLVGRGDRRLDGALPIELMLKDAAAKLEFSLEAAPSSGGGETATFLGAVSEGFNQTAGLGLLEVYAVIAYDDEPHVDPLTVEAVVITNPNWSRRFGTVCQYVHIRDRVKTATPWTIDHVGYSAVRVAAGDEALIGGRASDEVARYHNAGQLALGDRRIDGAGLLTTTAPEYLPLISTPPGAPRSHWARGDVSASYTRTAHTVSRILSRYQDAAVADTLERELRSCLKGAVAVAVPAAANASPKANDIAAILPRKIVTNG